MELSKTEILKNKNLDKVDKKALKESIEKKLNSKTVEK